MVKAAMIQLLFLLFLAPTVIAQWGIAGPSEDYQGFKVKLRYSVSPARTKEEVRISYYKDEECTVPMIWVNSVGNKPFFNEDVYPVTGSPGIMAVDISMDVEGLSKAEILSEVNKISYVAYCVKFEFFDLDNPSVNATGSLNHELIVGIDLTGDSGSQGITGFLKDEEANFGTSTWFCDNENREVGQSDALIQGNSVRICVSPNKETRTFGVKMNRIEGLYLLRYDTNTSAVVIRDRGVIQNPRSTQLFCQPASDVCALATTPSNKFYTGKGQVWFRGEAYFMYSFGSRRRMVKIPFDISAGHRRQGSLAGKDAGNHTFNIPFQVEPADADHKPKIYRCDQQNQPLTPAKEAEPLYVGDWVRVCSEPDERAVEGGVQMHQIRSFVFTQEGVGNQLAINDDGIAHDRNTMVLCQAGDPVCAFKTFLSDNFFEDRIPIKGRGEFRLQFGDERLQTLPTLNEGDIITPELAGFAGSDYKEFIFSVTTDDPPPDRERSRIEDVENWWLSSPLGMRIIYVLLFVFILLLCCILFFLLLCGVPDFLKKGKSLEEDEFIYNSDAPFIPPNATKSKVIDDPNFCDCLNNPDEWELQGNAEYVPKNSRGMAPQDVEGGDWPPREFDGMEDEFEAEPEATINVPRSPKNDPALLAIEYGEDFDPHPPQSYRADSFYSETPSTPSGGRKAASDRRKSSQRPVKSPLSSSRHSVQSQSGRASRPGKKRDPTISASVHSRASVRDPTLSSPVGSSTPGGRKKRGVTTPKKTPKKTKTPSSRSSTNSRKSKTKARKKGSGESTVSSMPVL